ncbi:hypothetical protein MSBRM_0761 [Methanosarcina barkeri MS]|uniref:Uncharacterized protein n=1 Tax=Methanosarcina barkeri MS TaxID=1434108 RepID=A0A0E3QSD7_METBA|nr:hypothetical protein MSBRM_0761 [Methanosarcina barkeri MS]
MIACKKNGTINKSRMDENMKMTKSLKSISRFATVLMVLCILPSGAYAAENSQKFVPAQNITEENFTDVQADILDSTSEQIANLQSFYTNVSETSNASELQKVLLNQAQANGCGPDGKHRGPEGMNQGPCGMPGLFNLDQVANVTDDNYTDVQTDIVSSIGNMTEMLNKQLENNTDENRTEMINEQITELEDLSTNVSAASSATELQEVVLTHMKTQAVDSIEKEIEHIQAKVSESENITDDSGENVTELNDKITELTTLMDNINATESLEDLKEIMSSSQGMPGMGHGMDHGMDHGMCPDQNPMQRGGNFSMCPGRITENSTDNSTEA